MNINGIEFELNLYDYNTAKRYEDAIKTLSCAKGKATGMAETIKEQCGFARGFIDAVLGKGSSDKLFEDTLDLYAYTSVVGQILSEGEKQKADYAELVAKYAPNRDNK